MRVCNNDDTCFKQIFNLQSDTVMYFPFSATEHCIDKKRNECVTVDEEHHLTEPQAEFSLLFQ